MTQPKTPAQRKADERERRRQEGLVSVTVWIHPASKELLHKYVKRLNLRSKKDHEQH